MKDRAGLTGLLRDALSRNYGQGTWHHGVKEAVSGLSGADAAWRPHADVPSIIEMVGHLTIWKNELARLLGGQARAAGLYEGKGRDFPPREGAGDDDWHTALLALDGAQELLERSVTEASLGRRSPHLKDPALNVVGCLAHDSYHAAQIILLRKLRGLWHEPGHGEASLPE